MTNYSCFPKWRKYGIVMKFTDSQYSWCENTPANRKYLIESDYCNGGIEFYVWENDTIYKDLDSFKDYLKNKVDNGTCPLCGKPLVVRRSKTDYEGVFLGCSGWPECKFTKKA